MSKYKLRIHLDGSASKFTTYLKNFAKINPSLLLEIDAFNNQFIAKTFSEDKASVRFSAITFDECNMSVIENTGDSVCPWEFRIKLGILLQLPKMIKILERFESDYQIDKNRTFDIIINYDFSANGQELTESTECVAETIRFSSSSLEIKMDGFRSTEFRYLSDDTFNNTVYKLIDPIPFEISGATISNIIKTSDIVKSDPKRDILIIYVDGKDVCIKDYLGKDTKGKDLPANFVYKLGELPDKVGYELRLPMFRERFIEFLDRTDETFTILFGKSIRGNVDRLVMRSNDSETRIVISTINEQ